MCRNWLLKRVIEGKIEVTERQGRRRKQPLDDLKIKSGYWKLKEEALDCTLHFGGGYRLVARIQN